MGIFRLAQGLLVPQHYQHVIYIYIYMYDLYTVGRNSSVFIATRHRLDGPWIESRWGQDFLHPSRPAMEPTRPSEQWVPGLSRG